MSDEENTPGANVDVTMALGFTDMVKAIREALGLVDDVVSKVDAVSEAYKRQKGKKAAGNLDTIAFGSDGSRKHLEKIAAGNGQPEDFEAIARKMGETGQEVEAAINRLKDNRDFIRERFGANVAHKIDDMIYSGQGKQSLRVDLQLLARMDHSIYSADEIAAEAQRLTLNIQQLNEELANLHDALIGIMKK